MTPTDTKETVFHLDIRYEYAAPTEYNLAADPFAVKEKFFSMWFKEFLKHPDLLSKFSAAFLAENTLGSLGNKEKCLESLDIDLYKDEEIIIDIARKLSDDALAFFRHLHELDGEDAEEYVPPWDTRHIVSDFWERILEEFTFRMSNLFTDVKFTSLTIKRVTDGNRKKEEN